MDGFDDGVPHATERQYRILTESMKDVFWILDPATYLFSYVSPSVEALRGYSPAEIMAGPVDAEMSADSSAVLRDIVDGRLAALDAGSASLDAIYTEVVEQSCKDGSTVWTEVTTRYHRIPDTGRIEVYGVTHDITARRESAVALAESERHFRLLANNMSDVVVWIGSDGAYRWVSPSLTDALGWQPQDWVGLAVVDHTHPDDTERFMARLQAMMAGTLPLDRGVWVDRFRMCDSDGVYHWVETRSRLYVNEEESREGAVATLHVIDSILDNELELERRARFDDLTGALKREETLSRLTGISRGLRSPSTECGVLFIDVDDLKKVNDVHGHLAGDALLATLSARFAATVRAGDSVARIGGDEFLVILDGLHGLDEAVMVAEKIRNRAIEPVPFSDAALLTSVSIGVTLVRAGEAVDDIIDRADKAMYTAKHAGGNAIVAAPPQPAERR
jgi:diguanylate cyclase (GGDEF)-like protein/PAS domain S-box-containing protein